ncbi:Putative uncharacterized protein [Moritella viscosa]|uniref:Uncharacterized protein n=1 Tax=Moritella viscosa TaxID=80854 RepID=A0A1L0AQ66_9GAMM|nr:Putative uncharacterized protein [Moritella viscosa]SGY90038.1 Putative uncharacterized protein [Moritella viscosa]SGY90593.1 Putative uncharacterized protein [Moritella viscosa]SHO00969.1 Putative uncharacterized protein [Moritella viscosa]SHO01292.1 Putative uncharacterized protein [Moritella viscosa]
MRQAFTFMCSTSNNTDQKYLISSIGIDKAVVDYIAFHL